MSRVLIVSGPVSEDPVDLPRMRLGQVVRLLRGFGCSVDLLTANPGGEEGLRGGWAMPGIRAYAVAPAAASELGRDEHAEGLLRLVDRLQKAGGEEYRGVYLLGASWPDQASPATALIWDAMDGLQAGRPGRSAALVLAADETVHSRSGQFGVQSARLPLAPEMVVTGLNAHGAIGWPGRLNNAQAEAWTQVLAAAVARGISLSSVLIDPEAVPPEPIGSNAADFRAQPQGYALRVQCRALSLAMLPGPYDAGHLARFVTLAALGCPILTGSETAERFEGRWQVPTVEDADHFAGWMQGWVDGRERARLTQAGLANRGAFAADRSAMEVYVSGLLKDVIARRA